MDQPKSPFSAEQAAEKPIEFAFLQDPEQRKLLAERVADLVKKTHEQGTTAMVFLDKSARPVAHLFHELWKGMYPGETGPAIRFLNIGKEYVLRVENEFTITEADEQAGVAEAKKQRIISCLKRLREQYKMYEAQEAQAKSYMERDEIARQQRGCRDTFFDILRQSYDTRNSDESFNADLNSISTNVFKGDFSGDATVDAIKAMDDTSIRSIFGEKLFGEILAAKQFLPKTEPGKQKITIVNEYSQTGGSLALAERFIKAAFKDKAGEVSTTAVATEDDGLFDAGLVPWRTREDQYGYGRTGVIDNNESIFAAPYYALDRQIHERNTKKGLDELINEQTSFKRLRATYRERLLEAQTQLVLRIPLVSELPDLSPAVKQELGQWVNEYRQCLDQDPWLQNPDTIDRLNAITNRQREILKSMFLQLASARMENEQQLESIGWTNDEPKVQNERRRLTLESKSLLAAQKQLKDMADTIRPDSRWINAINDGEKKLQAQGKFLSSDSSQASEVRQLRDELSAIAKEHLASHPVPVPSLNASLSE